jgi:C4-type Zn-finger protein
MESLSEWNARKRSEFNRKMRLINIACPTCSAELYDRDPGVSFTTNPPQRAVVCIECGFNGFRIC